MNLLVFACFMASCLVKCDQPKMEELKIEIDDAFSDEYVVDMDIEHLMKAENKTLEDVEHFNENELG